MHTFKEGQEGSPYLRLVMTLPSPSTAIKPSWVKQADMLICPPARLYKVTLALPRRNKVCSPVSVPRQSRGIRVRCSVRTHPPERRRERGTGDA